MRLFYYFARNINYTFAITFYTVIFFWTSAVIGAFLTSAFIIFPYDKIITIILKWLPVSVFIITFLQYLQFGFFTPVKIPALLKSHRVINLGFKYNLDLGDIELKKIYRYLSILPYQNTLFAAFYIALLCFLLAGFGFYEHKYLGSINAEEVKIIYKSAVLAMVLITLIYCITTYLLTEFLTIKERALTYNKLLIKGIKTKPIVLMSFRIKFLFSIILMVITLLTFVAIMEKIRIYDEFNLKVIIPFFILSVLISLSLIIVLTNSIATILNDFNMVVREITKSENIIFKNISLDREFGIFQQSIMELGWKLEDQRINLENRIDHANFELNNALEDLKDKDDLFKKQLNIANIIQKSILPEKISDWNELKFSIRNITMEQVGGDFHDIYHLKDNKLGIIVADVSGHGIPAALVSSMAKISFGNAGSLYDSPKKIFQSVNNNILENLKTNEYMTCFMVSVDDDYNVVYSNAGHQKAILLRMDTQELEELDTEGLFIGTISDASTSYEEKSTKLNYGDRLILFTDGIPEALNSEKTNYSLQRLEDTIVKNCHLPLEEFTNFIIEDVQNFIGNASIEDDLTLFVIELSIDEAVQVIRKAGELINKFDYNEAVEVLEAGLISYPDNPKILYNYAKNLFRVDNFKKCNEIIEKYIENDKRNKFAYYIAGSAYYQLMDYEKAAEYFKTALKLDSFFTAPLFALGMTYKKNGDNENAIKTFERVINIDPDNKMAFFELKLLREED